MIFPLLKHPSCNKYLADLLTYTLPGIDTNDLRKTWSTFKFYSGTRKFLISNLHIALLVCLPLFGQPAIVSPTTSSINAVDENDAGTANDAISSFSNILSKQFMEDWCLQLLDRIFLVLCNQLPPVKNATSQGKDKSTDGISPELFWVC